MTLVLILGAVIWGLGMVMKTPVKARFLMLGLLYVAVLFAHLILPDGHPLRQMLGGGLGSWLVLGGLVALIAVYRAGLTRMRARARVLEADRADDTASRTGPFSDDELERYARHIVLREVGGPGQKRLKDAKVLVVGAGGLGAPVLLYLGAAGVGTIGVIDDDTVSTSNLQRQIIHADADFGSPKVHSAAKRIRAINPHVSVRAYNQRLTPEVAPEIFADYDLIVDGTDTFATRQMVNDAAVAASKPLIAGAITQWEGQVTIYDPAAGAPCLTCLFPKAPAAGLAPSCAEAGVIGALPGIIGSIMALETIKEITGAGTTLRGILLLWDGLDADARRISVAKRPDCPTCGSI